MHRSRSICLASARLEVSYRMLWAGVVAGKDISRPPSSIYDSGRASQPAFQDMNFGALRRGVKDEPLPVLYQHSEDDPFDARMLVMAYEEEGRVVFWSFPTSIVFSLGREATPSPILWPRIRWRSLIGAYPKWSRFSRTIQVSIHGRRSGWRC